MRVVLVLCVAGLLTGSLGGRIAYAGAEDPASETTAVTTTTGDSTQNAAPVAGEPAPSTAPPPSGDAVAEPPPVPVASAQGSSPSPGQAEPDSATAEVAADLAAEIAALAGPLGLSLPPVDASQRTAIPCPVGTARWAIRGAKRYRYLLERATSKRARALFASRMRARIKRAWMCLPPTDPAVPGTGATGGGEHLEGVIETPRRRHRPEPGVPSDAEPATTVAPSRAVEVGPRRIPSFLLPIYRAAGARYGVPWEILAAINEIETDYGRNLGVSSAGAIGWMQFMPGTWRAYGVDANGDAKCDPYAPDDAIFAAARYLRASGAAQDLPKAIFAYNHAAWYVASVLTRARRVAGLPVEIADSPTPVRVPSTASAPAGNPPVRRSDRAITAAAPAMASEPGALMTARLAALLNPSQWMKVIERLARIADPTNIPRMSRYAVPTPRAQRSSRSGQTRIGPA